MTTGKYLRRAKVNKTLTNSVSHNVLCPGFYNEVHNHTLLEYIKDIVIWGGGRGGGGIAEFDKAM